MATSRLPQKLPIDMMQTKWAAILNPLLLNPYLQGNIIQANLINGTVVINHLLGRMMQGWTQVDIDGPAVYYRSAPFNFQTLTLTSNAAANISLYVF